MTKLVEPELSFKIVGVLFRIHNKLGGSYQEKYYQRAVAIGLKEKGLHFKEQIKVDLNFGGQGIGRYFIDFVVENKVVLELKAKPILVKKDFNQVSAYLKANKLELGILANFRGDKLISKRILNPELKNSNHSD